MHSTHYLRGCHISMNVYRTILFWVEEFSGFRCTKTSVNKRLYLCHVTFTSGCDERGISRPLIPGAKHYGGKDTTFFLKDKVYLKKHPPEALQKHRDQMPD